MQLLIINQLRVRVYNAFFWRRGMLLYQCNNYHAPGNADEALAINQIQLQITC